MLQLPACQRWQAARPQRRGSSRAAACRLSAPQDVLAACEAAATSARAAVAAYRERLPAMLRLPAFMPPPPEYLSAMEARAAEAEGILEAIKAGTYVEPAAAAPPATQAAGEAAPTAAAATPAAPATAPGTLSALESRLAALEAETLEKDAQASPLWTCLWQCSNVPLPPASA